jgi:hypothetical protein
MKVLLTGADGYIGARMGDHLIGCGVTSPPAMWADGTAPWKIWS